MTPECFDALKRVVPCVVRVPEPGGLPWELVLAVLCLVAMYGWVLFGRKR